MVVSCSYSYPSTWQCWHFYLHVWEGGGCRHLNSLHVKYSNMVGFIAKEAGSLQALPSHSCTFSSIYFFPPPSTYKMYQYLAEIVHRQSVTLVVPVSGQSSRVVKVKAMDIFVGKVCSLINPHGLAEWIGLSSWNRGLCKTWRYSWLRWDHDIDWMIGQIRNCNMCKSVDAADPWETLRFKV